MKSTLIRTGNLHTGRLRVAATSNDGSALSAHVAEMRSCTAPGSPVTQGTSVPTASLRAVENIAVTADVRPFAQGPTAYVGAVDTADAKPGPPPQDASRV